MLWQELKVFVKSVTLDVSKFDTSKDFKSKQESKV